MCRKGRPLPSAPISATPRPSAQLQAEVPQPRLAGRLIRRASAMVARTSLSASCAASCARPLAAVRCSSLKDGRRPSSLPRPLDALGPQRVGAAHHVQQVPAAAAVLPLARVGVDQVAPEQVARDLVVEADAVVAHAHRAGRAQLLLDGRGKLVLGHALLPGTAAAGCRSAGSSRGRAGVGRGLAVHITGAPISFRSASVRTPANCAGRSRRGTRPKVS
jgi:hypothetical protein